MKKFFTQTAVFVVVFGLVLVHTPQVHATTTDPATLQLILQLLDRIKSLQAQLETLQAKDSPKVTAIKSKDKAEYKEEVEPLVDELEAKNEQREALVKKLDEAKCIKSNRMIRKDGTTIFKCFDKIQATTTIAVFDKSIGEYVEYPVLPLGVSLPEKAKEFAKQIALLDKEIAEIKEKINLVKIRHGL